MPTMALLPAVVWRGAREDRSRVLGTLQKRAFKLHFESKSKYWTKTGTMQFILLFFEIYYFKGNYMYPIENFEKDYVASD